MSPHRPRVRDDVALMPGYHSPQIDVAVRLNTNESPVPPPAELTERVQRAIADVAWHRYPDRGATELRTKLARHYGVDAAQVFVANGSNEVLQSLLVAYGGHGRRALTFEPTYALHSHIARLTGTEVVQYERRSDFTLDVEDVVAAIGAEQPTVTFLCSPNNPTGIVDPPGLVLAALEAVEAIGGLLVVDEAYGQFAPSSAVAELAESRSLVVSRTFSKTWSMAGLRLGYLLGPSWVIAELDKVVLPYHLDVLTQIVGTIALDYHDDMEARVRDLVAERERLTTALARLPVQVWPSGSNFVLFRPDHGDGEAVWQRLVDQSVLVRNCASWPGLEGCLRVTVGTGHENDLFLAALEAALQPQESAP